MHESAIAQMKKRNNKDRHESYGWDVFNADSIYKAYEKRVNKIPKLLIWIYQIYQTYLYKKIFYA